MTSHTLWETDPAIKTKPFEHQATLYAQARNLKRFALFWEMGLGKTKVIVDVASHLFLNGRIDGLLVVAPNSVYTNWLTQELPPHMAVPYAGMAFKTKKSKSDIEQMKMLMMLNVDEFQGRLRFLCMSYDHLRLDRGMEFALKFVKIYRTMIVADESSKLKNPKTQQSKRAKTLASYCHYKWIATGTPATESPFAVHSQLEFIEPEFWKDRGLRSLSAFKTEFGVFQTRHMGPGRKFQELQEYRNLDKLQKIIEPISSRLLKEDSTIKLPPKLYTIRTFELSDEQQRIYGELRDEYTAELENGLMLEAPMAIVRLTRLQQICSGHVSVDEQTKDEEEATQLNLSGIKLTQTYEEVHQDLITGAKAIYETPTPIQTKRRTVDIIPPGENPRLQLLMELIEESRGKVIVWCRFTRDVDVICEALSDLALRYDGKTTAGAREIALKRFRDPDDPARVFVANTATVSMGITLTIAKTMIYYSNGFSLENRLQSEDRFHRIGQDQSVQIIDLIAEGTVDGHIVKSLREKFDIQAQVTGDRFREWIG